MKTFELTGAALDWAVTKCEGYDTDMEEGSVWGSWGWATDWAQGGAIIEREEIDVSCVNTGLWSAKWWANNSGMVKNPAQRFKHNIQTYGPTPLIAAMRCYVASKLGDEVDLPKELS